jgi:amino acid transporter
MSPTLRNILAGLAGAIASQPANMLLLAPMARLTGAPELPQPPEGMSMLEVREFYAPLIAQFEPVHFVGPIVAHWNGAFIGALVAALLMSGKKGTVPLIVASLSLVGGIMMAFLTSSQPVWSMALDLAGYLPMGWLGWQLALRLRQKR